MKTWVLLICALVAMATGARGEIRRAEKKYRPFGESKPVQRGSLKVQPDPVGPGLAEEREQAAREQAAAERNRRIMDWLNSRPVRWYNARTVDAMYTANAISADARLKKIQAIILGTVTEINHMPDGTPAVMLDGLVCCMFGEEYRASLMRIRTGDRVIIQASGAGTVPYQAGNVSGFIPVFADSFLTGPDP